MPPAGQYLWEWFHGAGSMRRYQDGYPCQLTPPEWLGWQEMTGNIVRPEEWQVLRAIDAALCGALSSELSDQRARHADSMRNKKHG